MSPNKTGYPLFPGLRSAGGLRSAIAERLRSFRPDGGVAAAIGILSALAFVLLLLLGPGAVASRIDPSEIRPGQVANRDIVADREISYVDQKATELRIEAELHLVLPVYEVDDKPASRAMERFRGFQDLLDELVARRLAGDTLYLKVQSAFPGLMSKDEVLALARSPLRSQAEAYAESMLRSLLENGIAAIPASGLSQYNPDYVELRRLKDGRPRSEEIPAGRLVTLKNLEDAIDRESSVRRLARPLAALAAGLVRSFAVEDAFFDADQSSRRLDEVRERVEPVVRTIAKGERLVRQGAIITEADAERLSAAFGSASRIDWGATVASLGLIAAAVLLGLFFLGGEIEGRNLSRQNAILSALSAFAYFAVALALARAAPPVPLGLGFLLPTALLCMLSAIMMGPRFAVLFALVLALLAQAASGLDARLFVFSLLSGTAATFSVRAARSRIDLVKAGAILALLEAAAAVISAIPGPIGASILFSTALWGAVNGFGCSIVALALLPVLEQAFNLPTRFRLMELSDLNSPILKRLLTVAPGTYSHSVTVAHLAESACREIGADPLLARVGAYYHDIGKIEQPEYFIENQAGYNKHDEINPRLSATVIRSHVKLGAERARSLGLPQAVIDIVAQHHGNAVITWFYDQARKTEGGAEADDFAYPGQPPASREAAVVMLADSVEAASRTLKRPTMTRLEDFIREIIMDKVRQGQLDRCDLTFKDLDTIRTSFTRILAGQFHSRIEYPKHRESAR
ncbi:MAG TPA: HDIG domain-containing protein [Rectinemataceae bacterium]|nr:HDIG domain-containing protein [Rectinemataceae bacterium]